jgi:hypothetical protein
MGVVDGYLGRLVLRFAAGAASACVLVGVSGWALAALGARGRGGWSGAVFSGVGVGIALAGMAGLVAASRRSRRRASGAARCRERGGGGGRLAAAAPPGRRRRRKAPAARHRSPGDARLIAGYGAFGFGYIVPATFLPAMAREAIADPAVYGWIWPAFGATAAASTALVAVAFAPASPARLWDRSHAPHGAGVIAPVLAPGLAGCSFGLARRRHLHGRDHGRPCRRRGVAPGAAAPRLMAAMTAAFALGQLAGPVVRGRPPRPWAPTASPAQPGRRGRPARRGLRPARRIIDPVRPTATCSPGQPR